MLLRSLPDFSASDNDFRSWFQSKWGRENCIVWGRTRRADFGPYTHTLSIRAVWGGEQFCHLSDRTIAVDDDNYLILNHGQIYSTSIRSGRGVEALAICFRPDMIERMHRDTIDQALARGDAAAEAPPFFFENLRPHDAVVSPVLRFIRAHLMRGVTDEAWYDEQLVFLLARMQSQHDALIEQVDRLALVRRTTRCEVHRRVGRATDFLHTHYAQDVDLATLAKTAYLSKYHFLRLFTLVHGVTPRNFLQRKRTAVALRLLNSTQLTMSEVAASVGFADESTLLRQMRRWTNLTPGQIRSAALRGASAPQIRNTSRR